MEKQNLPEAKPGPTDRLTKKIPPEKEIHPENRNKFNQGTCFAGIAGSLCHYCPAVFHHW